VALLLLLIAVLVSADAHDLGYTEVWATFSADGSYEVDVLADTPSPEMTPAALAAFAERVQETVPPMIELRFDETRVRPSVSVPGLRDGAGPLLGPPVTIQLAGVVPEGARTFTWRASPALGPVLLVEQQGGQGASVSQWLDAGDASEPFSLTVAPREKGFLEVVARYVGLGVTHIVPRGLDHILFVLGLFLLSTKLRPLLWQVTAFTVAHSVSLALSMLGVVSLPSTVVEPLIALSIAWVAFENIVTTELKPWRPVVVFVFGLLHGLGFASVLVDLGMPRGHFLTALVGFNAGVEIGQLTVIGFAFAGVGWYWKTNWYRPWVVVPASGLIAAVGLYWAVERALLL